MRISAQQYSTKIGSRTKVLTRSRRISIIFIASILISILSSNLEGYRINNAGMQLVSGVDANSIKGTRNTLDSVELSRIKGASGDPAVVGQWEGPYAWPVVAIHSFLLPTKKVLQYSLPGNAQNANCYIWDPQSLEFTPIPVNRPLFCSGHSFLSDGRLLVTGGNGPAPEGEFRGIRDTHIFDPFSETWTRIEDMADGRWYPTNVTLADGSVIVFSGLDELSGEINTDVERYQADDSSGWQIVSQVNLPLYPRMHMLSSGDIFYSGPSSIGGIYSIEANSWYGIVQSDYPSRYDGMSVLLPPGSDRVMIIGGRSDTIVTATAEIINFQDSVPLWRYTQPMNYPRMHANSVIMPDSKILVVGGHSSLHHADTTIPPSTVYEAEIFDPATESWSVMAAMQRPREYHSTATLLADGRILLAGSNSEYTAEIFSPPYLFRGARPIIDVAPDVIGYGSTFELQFISSTDTNNVVLVRLSSTTHSINMDQRYVWLAEVSSVRNQFTIPAPADPNIAPPGYYMLFVVDKDEVPSEAKMVKLESTPSCCVGIRGDFNGDGDDASILDLTFLVDFIFRGSGDPGECPDESDVNGDSNSADILDLTYLVDFIFRGGPAPGSC